MVFHARLRLRSKFGVSMTRLPTSLSPNNTRGGQQTKHSKPSSSMMYAMIGLAIGVAPFLGSGLLTTVGMGMGGAAQEGGAALAQATESVASATQHPLTLPTEVTDQHAGDVLRHFLTHFTEGRMGVQALVRLPEGRINRESLQEFFMYLHGGYSENNAKTHLLSVHRAFHEAIRDVTGIAIAHPSLAISEHVHILA